MHKHSHRNVSGITSGNTSGIPVESGVQIGGITTGKIVDFNIKTVVIPQGVLSIILHT